MLSSGAFAGWWGVTIGAFRHPPAGTSRSFASRVPLAPVPVSDEDASLVLAARHGNPDAFDELVRRHAARLHAVARRLVGSSDAADAVQECLMTAYQGLSRFRGEARFSTYLHAILVRQCRRSARRRARMVPWPDGELASVGPGPAENAERRAVQRQVAEAVGRLPAPYREAFVLRESAGLDYKEIARVLRVPVGTVRSRIARARERLRVAFEREGFTP